MSNRCQPSRSAGASALRSLLDAGFFKALGDPSRLRIFIDLARRKGPCTVSEAARCCPTCLSVVSRHLAALHRAGLLESRRVGKQVYYSVRLAQIAQRLRALADGLEACCPPLSKNAINRKDP